MRLRWIGILCLAGLVEACGEEAAQDQTSMDSQVSPVASSAPVQEQQTPVNLRVTGREAGFALAAADSYQGIIDGCVSGYQKSVSESTSSIQVQRGDVGCQFRLTQLTYLGEDFIPSAGQSWSVGQSFNVTGDQGTRLNVSVQAQLASPIIGTQTVAITFGAASEGLTQTAAANVSTGVTVTGSNPIQLDIVGLSVSVDGSDGAGLFDFNLECANPLVDVGQDAECEGVRLSDLEMGIGLDASGGQELTLAECKAYAAGGDFGTVFDAGDVPAFPNGGVDYESLKGPATLYAPANSQLIAAVAGSDPTVGCKYFRITVQAP